MNRLDVYRRLYDIARCIPKGKVLTYGQLAFLAGFPRGARLAGQAMAHAPEGESIPCHRVLNSQGCCAPGFTQQRALLQEEGVTFLQSGRVDMKRHLWSPEALWTVSDEKSRKNPDLIEI
jgi:methylated-DNA-protein-cysteine methyltransferase-like protein